MSHALGANPITYSDPTGQCIKVDGLVCANELKTKSGRAKLAKATRQRARYQRRLDAGAHFVAALLRAEARARAKAAQQAKSHSCGFKCHLNAYHNAIKDNLLPTLGDAALTGLGIAAAAAGVGIEEGGIALDITGVGAIVGVPANVAGIALMGTGGALGAYGGARLGNDLKSIVNDADANIAEATTEDASSNLYNGDGWQHVLERHVDGSPGVTPKSTTFSNYLDLEDIGELIEETAEAPGRPNTPDFKTGLPRDGTVHTVDFDYPVGSNGETIIEVVLNPDGSLRTAYPTD